MKNPNGYGSIFKLSGNRRNPFAVRITTGWDDDGKQVYEYLGYFPSRKKAMMALADYNNNPYDLSSRKITFKEMYERFKEEKFPKISKTGQGGYEMAFKLSESLHDLKFIDIKKFHMQKVIDNCDKSYETKSKIKVLYNQLYKHALENDLAQKDYARFVELPKNNTVSSRKPFANDAINILWENVNVIDDVDLVLIMIYTGLRAGELIEIKTNKVQLEKRFLVGGFKTEAGTNRIIPIHKKIYPLIERRMELNNNYLISTDDGEKMSYHILYQKKWKKLMKKLNLNHKPHDCRHTFATLMDNAGANSLSIKKIMGHASKDVTEKVYTHKGIEQLLAAIDMLE